MEAVSAILEELENKSFAKALELSNGLADMPEKYILKCISLIALGKNYSANYVVKAKLDLPVSAKLFTEMILKAGLESNVLYEKAAKESLGYLMWLALESKKIIAVQPGEDFWEGKLQLLKPPNGLSDLDRHLLYEELIEHDNSLVANLRYANAAVHGSKVQPPASVFEIIRRTLNRALHIEKENVEPSFELIMDAVTVVRKSLPLDRKLAKELLIEACKADPTKKLVLMTGYLDLYGLIDDKERLSFLVHAAALSTNVKEFTTMHEVSAEKQLQRLLDYLIPVIDKLIYSKNEIFQMAMEIFNGQEPVEQISVLNSLGYKNNLEDETVWDFMKHLFGLFIQDDMSRKNSSIHLLANTWLLGSEKLNKLLMGFAKQCQAEYLASLLAKYAASETFGHGDYSIIRTNPYMYSKMFLMCQPPEPVTEPVLLAIAAPGATKKAQEFTVRFVAYTKEMEAEISKKILQLSPGATLHTGLKKFYWKKGTKVTVRVSGQWLIVEVPEVTFIWYDEPEMLDFDVRVDPNAPNGTTVLKFDVLIDGLRIGTIRADLKVTSSNNKSNPQFVTGGIFQTVFASYSSKDRARVLDRVAEIRRNGTDVFLDVIDIIPGSGWQNILEKEIRERDAFYLFWSSNAMESSMVDWEWRTALKFRGVEGIDPHPLDPVADAPPPKELESLHFGDVYVLVRKATQSP